MMYKGKKEWLGMHKKNDKININIKSHEGFLISQKKEKKNAMAINVA